VLRTIARNRLSPVRIAEIGCGTGEVLSQLQRRMDAKCRFAGYDIAPDAIALSRARMNERLECRLGSPLDEPGAGHDLLLVLDVLEHQENYYEFLRDIKPLAPYKIFHAVLDLSVRSLLTCDGLTARRRRFDDLHFFTKDTILQALGDEHYDVVDWWYAPRSIYRAAGLGGAVRQWPRRLAFALHPDTAARLLGGFSLFVLAR